MEQGALVLWRLAGQKLSEIGRVNLAEGDAVTHKIAFDALHNKAGAGPVGICLPCYTGVAQGSHLPLAAAENLTQVLGFELGRQTPFTANQAYYDQRLLREDRGANRLHVLLGVASKTIVDQVCRASPIWGVTPQAIMVSDELESAGELPRSAPGRAASKAEPRAVLALCRHGGGDAGPVRRAARDPAVEKA